MNQLDRILGNHDQTKSVAESEKLHQSVTRFLANLGEEIRKCDSQEDANNLADSLQGDNADRVVKALLAKTPIVEGTHPDAGEPVEDESADEEESGPEEPTQRRGESNAAFGRRYKRWQAKQEKQD